MSDLLFDFSRSLSFLFGFFLFALLFCLFALFLISSHLISLLKSLVVFLSHHVIVCHVTSGFLILQCFHVPVQLLLQRGLFLWRTYECLTCAVLAHESFELLVPFTLWHLLIEEGVALHEVVDIHDLPVLEVHLPKICVVTIAAAYLSQVMWGGKLVLKDHNVVACVVGVEEGFRAGDRL